MRTQITRKNHTLIEVMMMSPTMMSTVRIKKNRTQIELRALMIQHMTRVLHMTRTMKNRSLKVTVLSPHMVTTATHTTRTSMHGNQIEVPALKSLNMTLRAPHTMRMMMIRIPIIPLKSLHMITRAPHTTRMTRNTKTTNSPMI